jgi:hypothetical protein
MTDEQWIDGGAVTDEEWIARVKLDFGIDVQL